MQEIIEKNISPGIFNRNLLLTLLKIIVTASLIYYLINIIDYNKISEALTNADYRLVTLAFVLTPVNIFLQFKKWQIICANSLNVYDKRKVFKSLLIGLSGGIITPFRLGEFVARALPFKNISLIEVTLATAIDKLFPLIVVSFAGGISAILFIHFYYSVSLIITLSLLIAFLFLFYLLYLLITNKKFWYDIVFKKLSRVKILAKHISKFKLLGELSPKITWKLTFLAALYYLTFTSQMALLIAAFLHQYDLPNYFWISNLVMFSQTIIPQVTIAELGIREGSTVFFMNRMGLSIAAGFTAAIILFVINLALPSIAGAFLIFKRNYD